ncbi:hypothetical protein Gdia_0550 [Gluconacetobacter diazotrophicus PA1 5]|uniref:hypothetical protein n=1 Tax=Gluconacetobacter diazotrophicus TaxID=33996 RepID=UPI000173B33F|nr:hypothetical protein [Gluconacetobacter diazotrophicus]ACI50344.1 hypothetical protein Gdia_0550 [Gluconacetobacter diazotrophicus PA1 5]
MSDTTAHPDLDLAEKVLKIANLHADSELKNAQRFFLPWQFLVSALALAFTAGAGLTGGLFALIRWKVGG